MAKIKKLQWAIISICVSTGSGNELILNIYEMEYDFPLTYQSLTTTCYQNNINHKFKSDNQMNYYKYGWTVVIGIEYGMK